MTLTAKVCFQDDFAAMTLSCSAKSECDLQLQVLLLIRETGIEPKRCYAREGGKNDLVQMAVWRGKSLDADLTRHVQFSVYDWMLSEGMIDDAAVVLPKRAPHVHSSESGRNYGRRIKTTEWED